MVSEFDWTGWAQLAQRVPEPGLRGPHSALRRKRPVGNPPHLQGLRNVGSVLQQPHPVLPPGQLTALYQCCIHQTSKILAKTTTARGRNLSHDHGDYALR